MPGNPKHVDMAGLEVIVDKLRVGATKLGQLGTQMTGAEITVLDSVTPGTVSASKALVVDANSALSGLGKITYIAGTATAAPINLTSGTNLTTAAAGAIEFDGKVFYNTAVASSRQVSVTEQFQSLTANRTLTDNATAQAVFNATTNGTVTLAGSTAYDIDAVYYLTNTGTTAHTWAVLFAGAATITAAGTALFVEAYTNTGNVITAVSGIYITGSNISAATVVTASSTSATENVVIKIRGRVNIATGGTFIPQIKASAQPNGTETILAGSFIRLWPIGADNVTNVGNWS